MAAIANIGMGPAMPYGIVKRSCGPVETVFMRLPERPLRAR
ncbi:hypothetical protein ACFQGX_06395 [Nonomuraea dietziae]